MATQKRSNIEQKIVKAEKARLLWPTRNDRLIKLTLDSLSCLRTFDYHTNPKI